MDYEGERKKHESQGNYGPAVLTCGDGDRVAILSTAHSTLVDHSSSPLSSSENAILNLLGHLRPDALFEELDS